MFKMIRRWLRHRDNRERCMGGCNKVFGKREKRYDILLFPHIGVIGSMCQKCYNPEMSYEGWERKAKEIVK